MKEIGLGKASWEIVERIGYSDHVAPLISPDGKKIAFAVTRHDHPTAVWIMNIDGTDIRKITPYYDSIAFAWLSDEIIVFWGSSYSNANPSNPTNFKYGQSYMVNVNAGDIQRLEKTPEKNLKVKYVDYSRVTKIN